MPRKRSVKTETAAKKDTSSAAATKKESKPRKKAEPRKRKLTYVRPELFHTYQEICNTFVMQMSNGDHLPVEWLTDSIKAGDQLPFADYAG